MFNSLVSLGTPHTKSFFRTITPFAGKIQFNGENWLSTVNQVNINAGDFTIECWVKIVTNPGEPQGIVGLGNDGNSFALIYHGSSGNIAFETGIGVSYITRLSTVSLPLNTWVHVAVVRDSAKFIKIYQAGTLVYTSPTTVTTNFATGTQGYVIGRQYADLAGNTMKDGCQLTGIRMSNFCRYTANFIPVATPMAHTAQDYAVFNFKASGTFLQTENAAYSMINRRSTTAFSLVQWVAGYP